MSKEDELDAPAPWPEDGFTDQDKEALDAVVEEVVSTKTKRQLKLVHSKIFHYAYEANLTEVYWLILSKVGNEFRVSIGRGVPFPGPEERIFFVGRGETWNAAISALRHPEEAELESMRSLKQVERPWTGNGKSKVEYSSAKNDEGRQQNCVYAICVESNHRVGPIWGQHERSIKRAMITLTQECECGAKWHSEKDETDEEDEGD